MTERDNDGRGGYFPRVAATLLNPRHFAICLTDATFAANAFYFLCRGNSFRVGQILRSRLYPSFPVFVRFGIRGVSPNRNRDSMF